MRTNIKKAGTLGVVWLLLISLILVYIPARELALAADDSAEKTAAFEAELSIAREEFFSNTTDETASLETINVDSSRIIHVPQEYIEPEPPSRAPQTPVYAGPFEVGDTRSFRASVGKSSTNDKIVTGELVGQGNHSNIWVLDDADYHKQTETVHDCETCHLNHITPTLAQNIANDFDAIYELVTTNFAAHSGKLINVGFGNMPYLGDLGEDGKVNFLLYDLYGDGGSSSSGYTAGFFAPGDFFSYSDVHPILKPDDWSDTNPEHSYANGLDMLHIDIGHNQGFSGFGASAKIDDKLNSYGTLAHELQHLLFYMYFSVNYADYLSISKSFDWINEALSELAGTYCVQEGAEIADFGRLSYAAQNNYASGDFLNFYSSKSYGMGKLFSMLMYKSYGSGYSQGIYSSIITEYPPANNYSQQQANRSKIVTEGHDLTVGRFLNAGTGVGDGVDTLSLLYYLFMENFAADGGMIFNTSGTPVAQATKFYSGINPVDNLWAIRSIAGISNGAVFVSTLGSGSYYSMSSFPSIPTYTSGSAITLTGYGTTPAKGASHEMLYKLSGGGISAPILTITAPNDSLNTRYYAVVPKDPLFSGSLVYTSGMSGSDVYPLTKGAPAKINTNGQEAYLFVSTLYQNVTSTSVIYSWAAAATGDFVGKVTLEPATPRFGDTITAAVTADGGTVYSYIWYSGGTQIPGAISSAYTTVAVDIGKTIRVEVKEASHSGSITAQTAPVAKMAGPAPPAAPTLFSKSDTVISLVEVAGCEYSRDGLIWQSSPVFTNLLPDTFYDFYQRIKATTTTDASAKSSVYEVSTFPPGYVGKPGDVNGDNNVDATDLSILISDFGKSVAAISHPGSDINKDGKVDATDLSILISNFGK